METGFYVLPAVKTAAASFDIAQGEIDKFPHAVFIVLLIKSRLVYYAYKQYESIPKARIFMAFDSEGIMQVVPLIDKGGYVVLDLYSLVVKSKMPKRDDYIIAIFNVISNYISIWNIFNLFFPFLFTPDYKGVISNRKV